MLVLWSECIRIVTGFTPNPSFQRAAALRTSVATYESRMGLPSLDGDSGRNVGEAVERLGHMSGPTVWTEFARLAQERGEGVVNLGQGFPDWMPPQFALDSLVEAATDTQQSPHQYTRTAGHPNLVNQLAKRYSIHLKQNVDPMSEVAVTIGASQALYLSLQVLVKPGTLYSFTHGSLQARLQMC